VTDGQTFTQWLNEHKGLAALAGGFASITAGAIWWLAKGGLVALTVSMTALNDPEVARALDGLPEYHDRIEAELSEVRAGQALTLRQLNQITDALETMRVENAEIVEWAPLHSQRLTDAVGGCYPGQKRCSAFFRGRRTQLGAGCVLDIARPRLILADGREFPIQFADDTPLIQLTTEFETIETVVAIPNFIPVGPVGLIVLTIYAECPFAGEGKTVTRETFQLKIDIKKRA
jgi:hypothetical protein